MRQVLCWLVWCHYYLNGKPLLDLEIRGRFFGIDKKSHDFVDITVRYVYNYNKAERMRGDMKSLLRKPLVCHLPRQNGVFTHDRLGKLLK